MYDIKPNLIIGFHGCDADTCHQLLNNPNHIKISREPHDWLGHGMYFWENNYERAAQWAESKKAQGRIKAPAVIGAVLQLGYCCDLLDTHYIKTLSTFYPLMVDYYNALGKDLPQNKNVKSDSFKDKLIRELDCSVIEFMHAHLRDQARADFVEKGFSDYKIFDSTRGVFVEGGPAFEGAAIFEKSHIQVCVRNLN